MAKQLILQKREATGKKLKALRNAGQIPSVIYGVAEPILTVSEYIVTEKALQEAGYHSPLELDIAGQKQLAIVKNIALNPVNRRIINIEFQAVSENEAVEATTPVKIVNFEQSEAAKKHLVILQVIEDVEVKAKPSELPSELTLDAANLAEVDDKLTFADLKLPKGVALADKEQDLSAAIANVYDPAAEAEAREAEDTKASESTSTKEAATPTESATE